MTSSLLSRETAADRQPQSDLQPRSSTEDELAVVAEELAAARDLHSTCDPDSPPWSVESELRSLELRWHDLAANKPPPPFPGGGDSRPKGSRSSAG